MPCQLRTLPLDDASERRLAWLLDRVRDAIREAGRSGRRKAEVHLVLVADGAARLTRESKIVRTDHPPE